MKLNGLHFYQRDVENMQRYPPHYGLHKSGSEIYEERKKGKTGIEKEGG